MEFSSVKHNEPVWFSATTRHSHT